MRTLSLAEAKMHLSAVVDQVEAGEEIVITRRGRRVARIGLSTEGMSSTWKNGARILFRERESVQGWRGMK